MIDDPTVTEQYTAAQTGFAARDAAAHEQDQKARRESLVRAQQLLGRIEATAARTDLTLKAGERALKEIRTSLASVPQLPSKKDYDDIVKRLKAAQTALMPKVQELRDVADWQRWANVGIQEQLCEKMEALKAVEDPELIAGRSARCRSSGGRPPTCRAPRAKRCGSGSRRRTTKMGAVRGAFCRAVGSAHRESGEEDRAVRARRGARRLDQLDCDRRRNQEASGRVEDDRGGVSAARRKAIWERFRGACDRFFTRRHADLAERKTSGPRTWRRRRRCAPRLRRSRIRPTGTRRRWRSSGCRPNGRRSGR